MACAANQLGYGCGSTTVVTQSVTETVNTTVFVTVSNYIYETVGNITLLQPLTMVTTDSYGLAAFTLVLTCLGIYILSRLHERCWKRRTPPLPLTSTETEPTVGVSV